jgi:predicted phosphodiesterase
MRTLVISDLHLGAFRAPDVLRDAARRRALIDAISTADRLVLLGDALELRHGPVRDALDVAADPLREIGEALGPDREVILTAGNHDHHLVEDWAGRRALTAAPPALSPETAVSSHGDDLLDVVTAMLAPARVRTAYPGIWLRDDVYAIHGHYIDLHLTVPTIERLAAAVMARIVALGEQGPIRSEDYEVVLAPLYAWIHAVAQWATPERSSVLHGGSVRGWQALTGPRAPLDLRRHLTAAAFPALIALLNRLRLGPLRPNISGPELRRAGLAAMGEVQRRLGIEADWILFGHTHRAGPLPADDPGEWRTPAGTALMNTGCWVHEPAFVGDQPATSPYRAGFAVWVQDDEPPRLVNLLDA